MATEALEVGELRARLTTERGQCQLFLGGTLDAATVPACTEWLLDSPSGGCSRCVLDLRGLDYIDSEGIRLLLRYWRLLSGRGTSLRVIAHRRSSAARVIRLLRLDQFIRVEFASGQRPGAAWRQAGRYRCVLRRTA